MLLGQDRGLQQCSYFKMDHLRIVLESRKRVAFCDIVPPKKVPKNPQISEGRRVTTPKRISAKLVRSVAGRHAGALVGLVNQAARAKAGLAARANSLYPPLDEKGPAGFLRTHSLEEPVTVAERHGFRQMALAPSTKSVRKSHLKKITELLCIEHPQIKTWHQKQVLVRFATPEGFETVATALAARGISSGANYLSSWTAMLQEKKEISPALTRF